MQRQTTSESAVPISSSLGLRVIRGDRALAEALAEPVRPEPASSVPIKELTLREVMRYGGPQPGLPLEVNLWRRSNLPNLVRGFRRVFAQRIAARAGLGIAGIYGICSLVVIRWNGEVLDYGLASAELVTDAGVNFIVDAWEALATFSNEKYHGIGTGTNNPAVGDTTLQTELTTQYNPDSTRATGSLADGGTPNILVSVGTNTVDATVAVTEHGMFNQAPTGAGTMFDRFKFAAVNLNSGDSLQTTDQITFASGG